MFRLVQGKTSIFNLKYIICKSPVLTDYVKKQIIDFCDLIDIFGQLVFHNFFLIKSNSFSKLCSCVLGVCAQLLLDPEELVVLGQPLGPAGGAGLDLACAEANHEVGDETVLGLPRSKQI